MEIIKKIKLNSILLIDDDADNNFIHQLIIKDSGWEGPISAVLSAKEAITYLNSGGKADLIFLDINMPVLSGWDFLEQYKTLTIDNKEERVIVMLTSSLNTSDENKAQSIPEITDYKNKPLTQLIVKELFQKYFQDLSNQ